MEKQRWKVKIGEECKADHSTVFERFKRNLFREKTERERIVEVIAILAYCLALVGLLIYALTVPVTLEGSCAAQNWKELPNNRTAFETVGMYPDAAQCEFKVSGPGFFVVRLLA